MTTDARILRLLNNQGDILLAQGRAAEAGRWFERLAGPPGPPADPALGIERLRSWTGRLVARLRAPDAVAEPPDLDLRPWSVLRAATARLLPEIRTALGHAICRHAVHALMQRDFQWQPPRTGTYEDALARPAPEWFGWQPMPERDAATIQYFLTAAFGKPMEIASLIERLDAIDILQARRAAGLARLHFVGGIDAAGWGSATERRTLLARAVADGIDRTDPVLRGIAALALGMRKPGAGLDLAVFRRLLSVIGGADGIPAENLDLPSPAPADADAADGDAPCPLVPDPALLSPRVAQTLAALDDAIAWEAAPDLREAFRLQPIWNRLQSARWRTRYCGNADLPPGTSWPEIDGHPLSFIAQVDLGALPPGAVRDLLPDTGLLSFFLFSAFSTHRVEDGRLDWRVLWSPDPAVLRPRVPPPASLRAPAIPFTARPWIVVAPQAAATASMRARIDMLVDAHEWSMLHLPPPPGPEIPDLPRTVLEARQALVLAQAFPGRAEEAPLQAAMAALAGLDACAPLDPAWRTRIRALAGPDFDWAGTRATLAPRLAAGKAATAEESAALRRDDGCGHIINWMMTETGDGRIVLLSTGSDSDVDWGWGDWGEMIFSIAPDDLAARRFDRVLLNGRERPREPGAVNT